MRQDRFDYVYQEAESGRDVFVTLLGLSRMRRIKTR